MGQTRSRWHPQVTWRRGDAKAALCTVIRAQRPANRSLSFTADKMQTADCQCPFLASRPQSYKSKGVWELRTVGCTSATGPGPKSHLGLCRDPALVAWYPWQTLQRSWHVFQHLRETETDVSLRLLGEGEVGHRHSPPGNTPCYLRRRDDDGLILRRQSSTAQGGDCGRVRAA